MWTVVVPIDVEAPAPSARSKHSATLVQGSIYVFGGRNGNLPLKDFWRYDLANGEWHQINSYGDKPPCLQEHTAVIYKDAIYVFGGEVGFSAGTETPLWCYDITRNIWRKIRAQKGALAPKGRRGHTALVHKNHMLIYGGYRDLRGSSSELWAFNFDTETWRLHPQSVGNDPSLPPPRHKHSAIIHDDSMYVYGGMTDLQARSDFWRWDLITRSWHPMRASTKTSPGLLHSHAVCTVADSMLLFGGEHAGQPSNELWRYSFTIDQWERFVDTTDRRPRPRSEAVLLAIATKSKRPTRLRPCVSVDRGARHSSNCLPTNRIAPSTETTYIFEADSTNYTDGSTKDDTTKRSFLQEISKLSRLNNRCSYTVLNNGKKNTDSTESLLRQHSSNVTPTKGMTKSKSAYAIKESRKKVEFDVDVKIQREPVSVPNFGALTLTPVEATKLVYLDPRDEYELGLDEGGGVKKGESYSSHLAYGDAIYRSCMPDGNISATSDYASIETVDERLSSDEGPFGFCNPNYVGPADNGEMVEMQEFDGAKVYYKRASRSARPPRFLPLDGSNSRRRGKETRASSAGRVERKRTGFVVGEETEVEPVYEPCIYLIGGKEHGQVTVFQRPISLWKLRIV